MGIYLPNMEMPKEAGTYRIEFDQCGNPYLLSENGDLGLWHIISVPDHGRLIDADAVERNLVKMQMAQKDLVARGIRKSRAVVCAMPTIIPADPAKEET